MTAIAIVLFKEADDVAREVSDEERVGILKYSFLVGQEFVQHKGAVWNRTHVLRYYTHLIFEGNELINAVNSAFATSFVRKAGLRELDDDKSKDSAEEDIRSIMRDRDGIHSYMYQLLI